MNGYQLLSAKSANLSKIQVIIDSQASFITGLVSQNVSASKYDVVFSGIHISGSVDLDLADGSLDAVFGFIGAKLDDVHGYTLIFYKRLQILTHVQ